MALTIAVSGCVSEWHLEQPVEACTAAYMHMVCAQSGMTLSPVVSCSCTCCLVESCWQAHRLGMGPEPPPGLAFHPLPVLLPLLLLLLLLPLLLALFLLLLMLLQAAWRTLWPPGVACQLATASVLRWCGRALCCWR
jgi:hypothetical protein